MSVCCGCGCCGTCDRMVGENRKIDAEAAAKRVETVTLELQASMKSQQQAWEAERSEVCEMECERVEICGCDGGSVVAEAWYGCCGRTACS